MRLFLSFTPPREITPYAYEPETIDYLDTISVGNNSTIWFLLTSYQITGAEIWMAIDTFAKSTKTLLGLPHGVNNLSTVFDIIYPFIGVVADQHKYNLCNPADTDAAFRLSFSGGWTFDGAGAQPNGSNGYGNTHWTSNAQAQTTRLAYGKYMGVADTTGVHGVWDLTNATRIYDQINTAAGSFTIGNTGGIATTAPFTRFHAVKLTSTDCNAISADLVQTMAGAISYTLLDKNYYIAARNNNAASVNQYTDGTLRFYFLTGKYEFSDAEMIAFNGLVRQLQIDLNRSV